MELFLWFVVAQDPRHVYILPAIEETPDEGDEDGAPFPAHAGNELASFWFRAASRWS